MSDLQYTTSKYLFSATDISLITNDEYVSKLYPVVYILFDELTMMAYVGESTSALSRLTTHLSHAEKKKLKRVYIISSELFNKSAVLDIESYLIQSIPSLGFKLLNANGGIANHNYFQKEIYLKLFQNIWPSLVFDKVPSKTLLEIENSDIFKYSPYKSLTQDQFLSTLDIIRNILTKNTVSTFVDGLAGTGKTILAIYLIKLLSSYYRYEQEELDSVDESLSKLLLELKELYPEGLSIGFVVPMSSLRNTLKSVFKEIHGLSGNMVIGPGDVVKKKYDIIIVDESHRLTRRKAITNYKAFDDTNKKLGLYKEEEHGTQLDWILKSSDHQVIFYDSEQSIKPADVRKDDFDKIKTLPTSSEVKLVSQLRSKGGKDYIRFIDQLLKVQLPANSKVFTNPNYELVLFSSMIEMVDSLRKREKEYGLSRMMSGYSWKWISRNPESLPDANIDGVELTWNRVSSDWINSTTDATEMGCIHTVQGYDLNFSGVIFGEEISFNKSTNRIVVNKANYHDAKGKAAIENETDLHNYIIKIYKTMMFRGIFGTYVYICDPDLREYFSKFLISK
jgi:DUF2075 family protein